MIDQNYLKECVTYDTKTGAMTWRTRPENHFKNAHAANAWNAQHALREAGTISETHGIRYRQVQIGLAFYKTHRLAWLYVTGAHPKNQIDHISGDGLDNRIANLRDVTNLENHRNMKMSRANTTGVCGVHPHKGKYKAQIRANGKTRHLGTFDTVADAARARKIAEKQYGYHENHGRIQ